MSEYRVRFEAFEGPLDLLLHLVKKQEVSIYEIDLARIATEFVAHLEQMRELDLEVAGEFVVMAATLVYIKSRELLPPDLQPTAAQEEEEGEDPRRELIRRLVEYRKFKDAALELQTLEGLQENIFERRAAPVYFDAPIRTGRGDASIFQLLEAVNQILRRVQTRGEKNLTIAPDPYTVSEKIEVIRRILSGGRKIRFTDLFEGATVRAEVIATFLAMLELARLRQLRILQPDDFGDIEVCAADPLPPSSSEETPASAEPAAGTDSNPSEAGPAPETPPPAA
jgi:segregation and condensation protein A